MYSIARVDSQSDIDANLACLPLFLAGCKELLVLPGATYPLRLWCVMELFTFIQMGGERGRITVRELVEGARSRLAAFDAAKAKCFLPKDKHKLLSVIEAGFGDLRPFNRVVRAILKERIDEADKEMSLDPRIVVTIGRL